MAKAYEMKATVTRETLQCPLILSICNRFSVVSTLLPKEDLALPRHHCRVRMMSHLGICENATDSFGGEVKSRYLL